MDLYHLRLINQIAVDGSLTRAGAALGVEQSVISRHLNAMEREFGGRLFHRTGRGMRLTDFGAAVMPQIQWLLREAERIEAEIRATAGVLSGDVRVGLLPAFSDPIANRLFRYFREHAPGISLHFFEGSNGQLNEWLAHGTVDVALLYRYGAQIHSSERVIGYTDAYLISRANPPFASGATIALRDLAGIPLVLPSAPNPLRSALDAAAKHEQITLSIVVEADSVPIQKSFVASGEACAILSAHSIDKVHEAGVFKATRIVDPTIRRAVVMGTSNQRPFTLGMRTVLQQIEPFAREMLNTGVAASETTPL